jgi:hypothetical protein
MAGDDYTKDYVKMAENRIYEVNDPMSMKWNIMREIASVQMLANFRSVLRNLISGTKFNMSHNGLIQGLKPLINFRDTFHSIEDAYEKGILQEDLARIMQDTEISGTAEKATTAGFKYSGWNAVESWTRAANMMSAKEYLRSAIKANQKNPMSTKSLNSRGFFKRLGIEDQQALLNEGGAGPITDRYLRAAVAETQGGYNVDQTPAFANSQMGKAMLQFQKWSTQALRHFDRNVVNPFLNRIGTGREEFVEVNGQKVKVPGEIMPIVRYALLAVAAGLTQKQAEEWIFGIPDKEASFAEIVSRMDKGDRAAFGALVHKLAMASISIGAGGLIGNYIQYGMDMYERSRFKDPFNFPSLSLILGTRDLFLTALEQGKLTGRDIDQFLSSQASAYRTGGQMAARVADVFGMENRYLQTVAARQDLQWLRSVTRRFDATIGHKENVTVQGRIGKNPNTPFYMDVREALMIGDEAAADKVIAARMNGLTKDARKEAMRGLIASVRGGSPIRAGGGTGEDMRGAFLQWAERNLPKEDILRIQKIDQTYRDTAVGLGLMKVDEPSGAEIEKALLKHEMRNMLRGR